MAVSRGGEAGAGDTVKVSRVVLYTQLLDWHSCYVNILVLMLFGGFMVSVTLTTEQPTIMPTALPPTSPAVIRETREIEKNTHKTPNGNGNSPQE